MLTLQTSDFFCNGIFLQSKEERILELETENALLHLRLAEVCVAMTDMMTDVPSQ